MKLLDLLLACRALYSDLTLLMSSKGGLLKGNEDEKATSLEYCYLTPLKKP